MKKQFLFYCAVGLSSLAAFCFLVFVFGWCGLCLFLFLGVGILEGTGADQAS